MEPRDYQKSIIETAKKFNTLVVLPTGMGKTLVALFLAKYFLETNPKSKVLFLAPTKPLAQQHFDYFTKNLPELYAEMQLFTGKVNTKKRGSLWAVTDIIFSTPQCIANDLRKNKISLEGVSFLIEDECHRCLKSYDYTYVASKFIEQSNGRILGLTASPGSDSKVIEQICKNLRIERVEVRNRDSEDVKPYIQELNSEVVEVEFPESFKKIHAPLKELYEKKIEEMKNRQILYGPATKKSILDLQIKLRRMLNSGNNHFNVLRGLSVCAQAIKLNHALELLETQGITPLNNYFKSVFDDAQKGQSKAVQQIVKSPLFTKAYFELSPLIDKEEHPKMEKLVEIVKEDIAKNPKSRFIVFTQYRDTVVAINKNLNKIEGIKSKVFVGQAKKGETGLSQKEQQQIIEEFKAGEINVLTSTSIGEEGLDLPEVNGVFFYEPIPSAIRRIQRTGRTARLKPGKLVILLTKGTRDEVHHWASIRKEKKMYGILDEMSKNYNLADIQNETKEKTLSDFN